MSNSLNKSPLNSVCTQYVCAKSDNARVYSKWQWNALEWRYRIALQALLVMQSSNTVSCVSMSFRTHPCGLAMNSHCTDGAQVGQRFFWDVNTVQNVNLRYYITRLLSTGLVFRIYRKEHAIFAELVPFSLTLGCSIYELLYWNQCNM